MTNRKALVVAINTYPDPRNNLPSCLDDAKAFLNILTTHYQFDQIERLYDEQATLEAVRNRLDWLFTDAQPDDQLVFYFSGHGFRVPVDGVLRECLCLHDSPAGFLFDAELVARSQAIPPGVFTAVLDSCHSGGMHKPFFVELPGEERTQNKLWRPDGALHDEVVVAEQSLTGVKPFGGAGYRLADPPLELATEGRAQADAIVADLSADASGAAAEPELNGLLLSAAQADQTASASTRKTSAPDGSEKLSAFTFCLRKAFQDSLAAGATVDQLTAADLLAATARELKQLGFKQTPLLKEPLQPSALGARTFITLRPPAEGRTVTAPPALTSASLDELIRALVLRLLAARPEPQPTTPVARGGKPMTTTHSVSAPGAAPGQAPAVAPDEEQAKFFGAILGAVLPSLIQTLPGLIGSLRRPRRDEAAAPVPAYDVMADEEQAKAFGALLSSILPVVIQTLPSIITAFRQRDEAATMGDGAGAQPVAYDVMADEEQAKFFGAILGAVLPSLIQTLPGLIGSLRRPRRDEAAAPAYDAVADEEEQAKFVGAILGAVLPSLIQTLPGLIGSLRRPRRDEVAAPAPAAMPWPVVPAGYAR